MKLALIFPGQGSQEIGMLADLATRYPVVQQTFAQASKILGYDLWQLAQTGPEEILNQTDKTQPVLLAAEIAIWRIWQQQGGLRPVLLAGHSFGEYSALVVAESLTFADAVQLAQDRGRFMQNAVPLGIGAAAAILGLEDAVIIAVCEQAAQGEVVTAVNFNAPGQVVIAGHKSAVERAMSQAKTAGAKRTVLLPVSVPVHCALMRPAAEQMAQRLTQTSFATPQIPVIHNVDLSTKTDPADIRQALSAQIDHPVRWSETLQKMAQAGVTHVGECGPGKVLTGLTKRIVKDLIALPLTDLKTLEHALQTVNTPA